MGGNLADWFLENDSTALNSNCYLFYKQTSSLDIFPNASNFKGHYARWFWRSGSFESWKIRDLHYIINIVYLWKNVIDSGQK